VTTAAPPQTYQVARPSYQASTVVPVSAQTAAPAQAPPVQLNPADQATVTFGSSEPGADIEINGSFVGNTPTALKLAPGHYNVTIRSGGQVWQRSLQVSPGSSITLNATFDAQNGAVVRRARAN
jgi:hypothetical protein